MVGEYKLVTSVYHKGPRVSLFDAPHYRPVMRLEALSSGQVRRVLMLTYAVAISGVIYTAVAGERADSVIRRFVLTPCLAIGYTVMVYHFLRLCFWECHGLHLREQVWAFLTLCICAVCALQVAMHSFQKVPHATVLAARVALSNVLKLMWLLLMDSFGHDTINLCSRFYGMKILFVTGNVVAEAVVLSLYSPYSPQEMAVTWTFYGIFVAWLIYLMGRSKEFLATQPYLRTRTRQLGFRFFCFQTTFVVVALLICLALDAITHRRITSGLTLMQHGYMFLVAYVHLPLPRNYKHSQHTMRRELTHGHCSFEASKIALQASYEVYQEEPFDSPASETTRQWLIAGGWDAPKNITVHKIIKFDAVGIQIMIIGVEIPKMTVVSFRGTANWRNVATDLATWRVAPEEFGPGSRVGCLRDANALIHKGFWSAYQSVRESLLAALKELYRPENKPLTSLIDEKSHSPCDAPLVYTGHSLGGALATLGALDSALLMRPLHRSTACFTFGSPRVGSYSFARLYNEYVPDTMRIVFERDLITDQPKFCFAFKHVGREILIDERGNCIAEPTFVERKFQASKTRLYDHSLNMYVKGFRACEGGNSTHKDHLEHHPEFKIDDNIDDYAHDDDDVEDWVNAEV